jgi:hypothetical protein
MRDLALRIILGVSTFTAGMLGIWATLSPRGFYDTFPGGGRHWISLNGPYNEHFIRDFGALNLALAVVTGVALVTLVPLLVRTAAVAGLAFAVPHLVYHLRHLDVFSGTDKAVNAVLLTGSVVLSVLALVLSAEPAPGPAPTAGQGGPGGAAARSGS